jgi:hypothetical protein
MPLIADTNNIVGVDTSLGCSPYCFKPTEKPEDEASVCHVWAWSRCGVCGQACPCHAHWDAAAEQ